MRSERPDLNFVKEVGTYGSCRGSIAPFICTPLPSAAGQTSCGYQPLLLGLLKIPSQHQSFFFFAKDKVCKQAFPFLVSPLFFSRFRVFGSGSGGTGRGVYTCVIPLLFQHILTKTWKDPGKFAATFQWHHYFSTWILKCFILRVV